MSELKRIVKFIRGHNCQDFECIHGHDDCYPGSPGFHGLHGMNIYFALKGDKGVVLFTLFTGWLPTPEPKKDSIDYITPNTGSAGPMPADLGHHSYEPLYEGQYAHENCEFLDGKTCYYSRSSLNAIPAYWTLVNAGEEALWKFLEQYYKCVYQNFV